MCRAVCVGSDFRVEWIRYLNGDYLQKKSCQTEGILTRTPMGSTHSFRSTLPNEHFMKLSKAFQIHFCASFLTPLWQLLLKCVSRHSPEVCPKGADTYKQTRVILSFPRVSNHLSGPKSSVRTPSLSNRTQKRSATENKSVNYARNNKKPSQEWQQDESNACSCRQIHNTSPE